jgi:hypothetical protein
VASIKKPVWFALALIAVGVVTAVFCYLRRPPTRSAPTQSSPISLIPLPELVPSPHIDSAPRLGLVTIGAFAPESLPYNSLSIESLDSDQSYAVYRAAVKTCYGADLADMNYLGVGVAGWQDRYGAFERWLQRANRYGDPTIAMEPLGPSGFGVFHDSPEMAYLRSIFDFADRSGITVWVRFASESNLRYSVYSVYNNPSKIAQYRRSVRWFRAYMPPNVRLVFSPLINTVDLQDPRQLRTIIAMYQPGAYDRIGGTLYATTTLRPRIAYDWYYHFMRRLDNKTPFQICELGSIYPRSPEVRAFLIRVAKGEWPGVQRVNLFAGDLNPLAVNQHGHFGFILPGENSSYLTDLLEPSGSGANILSTTDDKQLEHMEELGASWQSPEMTVDGTIQVLLGKTGDFTLLVDEVTDDTGTPSTLSPPRPKKIVITDGCTGADLRSSFSIGQQLEVTGWDSGTGTPLRATGITIGFSSELGSP